MAGVGIRGVGMRGNSLAGVIRRLFANNEQGAWYDVADFNANWRRNLLTYTEQFDNAAWTKGGLNAFGAGSVANATTDPIGGSTADYIQEDTSTGTHSVSRVISFSGGVAYTTFIYAKAAQRTRIQIVAGNTTTYPVATIFDLSNGTIVSTTAGTATIQSAGDGWYICAVTGTAGASANTSITVRLVSTGTTVSYTGDGTSGAYIWGAQLEVGSTASTYQRITDAVADYADSNTPVLYQDSAGTTLCSAVEQPVGLMLDKRKGLVLGPELVTFASLTGTAEWSYGSNVWTLSGSTTNNQALSFAGLTSGSWYRMTVTVTAINAGSLSFRHPNSSTVITNSPTISAAGTYTISFVASGTTVWLRNSAVGQTITVSAFSVREIAGNHAYQSTSAARPTLRARYNQITYSEQFDNAAWTKASASIGQNVAVAPDGTTTADSLIEDNTVNSHRAQQTVTTVSGVTHTAFVYAKKNTRSVIALYISGANVGRYFDLNAGTAGSILVGAPTTSTITSVGNGWYKCEITYTATASSVMQIYLASADGVNTYAGDGTSNVYLWGADLRPSNLATGLIPLYQRIAAATDYDTVGFPVYIQGNGSSQFMQTAAIDFSGTDKMTVWSAVRKLSDAAQGTVMELGTDSTSTSNGAFALFAPASAAANYGFQLRGTAYTQYRATTFTAPVSNVLSVLYDIAGALIANEVFPRVNAAVPSLADVGGASAGTGNFGNHALYLLSRGGASLWFGGYFYGAIIRGAATSDSDIRSGERYLNQRVKAY